MTNMNFLTKTLASRKKLSVTTIIMVGVNIGAMAASIQLYNTGVSGGGSLLPNGTVDPHYSLIAAPSPYTTAYTGSGGNAVEWLGEGPNSRWIGVSTFLAEARTTGTYTFRTTFDLTGLTPSSASLSLSIASDNTCNVIMNGIHTGITTPFAGFSSFSSYSINTGFINGLNTLDFAVFEPGGTPSGLRVELSGFATSVPEPGVATMVLAGTAIVFARFGKRNRKA